MNSRNWQLHLPNADFDGHLHRCGSPVVKGAPRTHLGRVKILSGLLPMCASCRRVRNEKDYWEKVEGILPPTRRRALRTVCARNAWPERSQTRGDKHTSRLPVFSA